MTNSSKDAVLKLVADAGRACLEYQREHLRNLPCKRIQCDKVWSFVDAKAKNVPAEFQGQFGYGDAWTWTAIDADTNLVARYARDGSGSFGSRQEHRRDSGVNPVNKNRPLPTV